MGLRQQLRDSVDQAFAALGDLPDEITYVKTSTGSYDVESDIQYESETHVTVQAVLYNGRDIEQDSNWRLTSSTAKHTETDETYVLIAASSLPNYVPQLTDYLLIDGERWSIFGKVPVPSNPCWILRVRQP